MKFASLLKTSLLRILACAGIAFSASIGLAAEVAEILTPPAPEVPRVNGPGVFGVRPGAPFLYAIPATGRRPMAFAAGRPFFSGNPNPRPGEGGICLQHRKETADAERPPSKMPYWNRDRMVCGDELAIDSA